MGEMNLHIIAEFELRLSFYQNGDNDYKQANRKTYKKKKKQKASTTNKQTNK